MSIKAFPELPDRGPGLKDAATDEQWSILAKDAVATIHCEPDACDECAPWDGETMRLPEAEEKVPFHFNCRCSWTYDWRPELSSLSMTSLFQRASGHFSATMSETVTKTATAAGIVNKTPTGVEKDTDGEAEFIRVPISSTGTDRDGDSFSKDGLKNLRSQIRETPRPVFENHGFGGGLFGTRYDWKDIIGTQVDAEIEAGDDSSRTLFAHIRPNPENERADQLLSYIKAGQAVGFSVGFRILDYDGDEDEGYEFHETDLLETSAVGIQSNREAVASRDGSTIEALAKSAGGLDADLDEETLASAMVSEVFARAGTEQNQGSGPNAGGPLDVQQRAGFTKDTTTMSDSDPDERFVTEQQLEEKLDDYQNDLIKGIAAELDGSLGEDDPEDEEKEGKGGDGVDSELKELAEQNADDIQAIKEAVESDETEPENAETANKASDPGSEEKGGEEPSGEKGTEPDAEKDTVGEDAEGWM